MGKKGVGLGAEWSDEQNKQRVSDARKHGTLMKNTDESVVHGVFSTWRALVQDHVQKERDFKLSFQAPGGNGPCGTLMGTVAALSPGLT